MTHNIQQWRISERVLQTYLAERWATDIIYTCNTNLQPTITHLTKVGIATLGWFVVKRKPTYVRGPSRIRSIKKINGQVFLPFQPALTQGHTVFLSKDPEDMKFNLFPLYLATPRRAFWPCKSSRRYIQRHISTFFCPSQLGFQVLFIKFCWIGSLNFTRHHDNGG